MQMNWGAKNESLTFTIGSGGHYNCGRVSDDFDKMTLQHLAKHVTEIHYLKSNMAKRVACAQNKMHEATVELARIKRGGLLRRSWAWFKRLRVL